MYEEVIEAFAEFYSLLEDPLERTKVSNFVYLKLHGEGLDRPAILAKMMYRFPKP